MNWGMCLGARSAIAVFAIIAVAAPAILTIAAPAWAQDEDEDEDAAPASTTVEPAAPSGPQVQDAAPKVNNLPQNFKGMSGLFFTTSSRTLDPGTVEVGTAYLQQTNPDPDYTRTEYVFNAGVGIPGNFEFGLHIPYVESNLTIGERIDEFGRRERTFGQQNHAGMGSVEGMFKWGYAHPSLFLPPLALGLGGIAPGIAYDDGVSEVKSWGARVLIATGVEINDLFFTEYAFAIMADGQLVLRDLGVSGRDYEEKSGEVHLGMVFPLHPRNFVTLIVEYDGVLMRGTTNEEDRNGIVGALRFTTHHINVTAGAEQVYLEARDMDDETRFFANLSYKLGKPYPLFP